MQLLKTFGCLLLMLAGISHICAVSVSIIGDVQIIKNDTSWKCDRIYCPENTYVCHVTKHKATPDATQLTRTNTCYDENQQVLQQAISYEPIGANQQVSVNITSYRNGGTSSSVNNSGFGGYGGGGSFYNGGNFNYVGDGSEAGEEAAEAAAEEAARQLEISRANVDRINEEVAENLRNINHQIQQQMHNLREQLSYNLGNMFNG